MKSKLILILGIVYLTFSSFEQNQSLYLNHSNRNFVPNKETAIKVAEAILVPIYGENILSYRPFSAELLNNKVWIVKGTLNPDDIGGVPIVKVQKADCKILEVTHTK
ncbi:MAG: YbbC/YhhH family protein [Flavobacterium sp.]